MLSRTHLLGVSLVLVAFTWTSVHARQTVVPLTSQHVTVHEGEGELGDHFTISVPIPDLEGQELLGAYLEFYVDVDAREIGGYENDCLWLDVFALTDTYGGIVEEEFGTPALTPNGVMNGTARYVRRDITAVVQGYLENPETNHGLIIGSLTGPRDGLFTLRTDDFGGGVIARLLIHHRRSR